MADEIIRGTGGSLAGEVSDVKRAAHVTTDAATPFNNTTDPTAVDDASKGYIVGMRWVNTVTDTLFTLVNSTVGAALWLSVGTIGPTHIFIPLEYNATISTVYRVQNVAPTGDFELTFAVPEDFVSLVELHLFFTPNNTFSAGEIDLLSGYGGIGENILTHSESQSLTGLSATVSEWNELDVSGVFSSLTAGDNCGLNVNHIIGIGGAINYIGVHLEYL